MSKKDPLTLLSLIREHNNLNGLWFVVVEFLAVILAALLISTAGISHGHRSIALAGFGISINALAVIAIALTQIRNHDASEGILKIASPQFRARLVQDHPDLGTHTTLVMLSVIVPLLLVALLALQAFTKAGGKQR